MLLTEMRKMGLGQGGINSSVMSMLGLKFLLDIQVEMLIRQLDVSTIGQPPLCIFLQEILAARVKAQSKQKVGFNLCIFLPGRYEKTERGDQRSRGYTVIVGEIDQGIQSG